MINKIKDFFGFIIDLILHPKPLSDKEIRLTMFQTMMKLEPWMLNEIKLEILKQIKKDYKEKNQ